MRRIFTILAIAAIVASCYKSDLTDATCPSGEGIVVDIVVPTLPEDASIPTTFTITVEGEETVVDSEDPVTLSTDLESGELYVYVYTNHESPSVVNDTKEGGSDTIIATADSEGDMVLSLEEHFYFGYEVVTITPSTITTTDVYLSQISCDISFNYYIAEGDPTTITALSAALSGIADQWECISDTPWGDPTVIAPQFMVGESLTKSTDDHIVGTIRILGIHGSEQLLTIGLTLSDGTSQTEVFDLSDDLKDVNSTKSIAKLVSGELKLINSGNDDPDDDPTEDPTEGSLDGGTLSDWDQGDGGEESIN